MNTQPLRVTPSQWRDIREHYEEDWSGYTDDLDDEDDDWTPEPVTLIVFPEPKPDEHQESDYDEANGDVEPPY